VKEASQANASPVILAEQQSATRLKITEGVNILAIARCNSCPAKRPNPHLATDVARKLDPPSEQWPPEFSGRHTLRNAARALHGMGNYRMQLEGDRWTCSRHANAEVYTKNIFEEFADGVAGWAYGLCLECTKSEIHPLDCPHVEGLKEEVRLQDPVA